MLRSFVALTGSLSFVWVVDTDAVSVEPQLYHRVRDVQKRQALLCRSAIFAML